MAPLPSAAARAIMASLLGCPNATGDCGCVDNGANTSCPDGCTAMGAGNPSELLLLKRSSNGCCSVRFSPCDKRSILQLVTELWKQMLVCRLRLNWNKSGNELMELQNEQEIGTFTKYPGMDII
jgi:hypothetical protein